MSFRLLGFCSLQVLMRSWNSPMAPPPYTWQCIAATSTPRRCGDTSASFLGFGHSGMNGQAIAASAGMTPCLWCPSKPSWILARWSRHSGLPKGDRKCSLHLPGCEVSRVSLELWHRWWCHPCLMVEIGLVDRWQFSKKGPLPVGVGNRGKKSMHWDWGVYEVGWIRDFLPDPLYIHLWTIQCYFNLL